MTTMTTAIATAGSLFSIEERLGKWIVPDLQCSDVLVLVGGHRHKLGRREWVAPHLLLCLVLGVGTGVDSVVIGHPDDVHTRLILVQAIEHDLACAFRLVRQLHLVINQKLIKDILLKPH